MRILLLAAALIPLVLSNSLFEKPDNGELWALLVAGSNSFWNYRHQADICHAYQILHRHGIEDDKIIVMMYDDIAENEENPDKGVIINKPNGTNVYEGVLKDYTGDDVNPQNFLNILQGNKTAMEGIGSGKVIESSPNDRVFVYFADHGGPGILCFPNEDLFVDNLTDVLISLHEKKAYGELLFYVEACESGSMFYSFLVKEKHYKIVATTASSPTESSWGWYCENPLGTCLGDEFSISWMEHVDSYDSKTPETKETVLKQYQAVKRRMTKSHPQLYGDKSIEHEEVRDFIGFIHNQDIDESTNSEQCVEEPEDGVPSRDVALFTAKRQHELAKTPGDRAKYAKRLQHLVEGRKLVDDTVEEIVSKVAADDKGVLSYIISVQDNVNTDTLPCYKNLIAQFKKYCFDSSKNTYIVGHYYKLANICSMSINADKVVNIFQTVCTDEQRSASGIH